ncbi:phospholipase D family protein [Spirulina sp. CS-785/01]|uniref:phospholipase D family protein n=1 Tax=Spirulina sp. CS-785/01 TaxID=3021716 RepID=UPI00232C37F4|nr:phospholipase D family protein [Spirulina sp. CS-785/01]MDB9312248.1 phospholipase D family protein [Spirulina sp. CS-785/01]
MKIIYEITGQYERLDAEGKQRPHTSLDTLLAEIHRTATGMNCYQLQRVQQSFGLSFLPSQTVPHLIQQQQGESPLLTNTHLSPRKDSPPSPSPSHYQFTSPDLDPIPLEEDDPQIPHPMSNSCSGIYRLTVLEQLATTDPLFPIYEQAKNAVQGLLTEHPLEVLQQALSSPNPEEFAVPLPDYHCTAWLRAEELPGLLQEALQGLTHEQFTLSEEARSLVQSYRQVTPDSLPSWEQIPSLSPLSDIPPSQELCLGRGVHQERLQGLIEDAEQFLLICSYRLEDEGIVAAIARKAREIPVWILTNFNSEVQDRVDAYYEAVREVEPEYLNSDRHKKECLRSLLKANIPFRSGDIHLKTYLSEKTAYLGSCNLTGGSLNRNPEAGIFWQNTPEHQYLLNFFQQLWHKKAKAQFIPTSTGTGFQSKSLNFQARHLSTDAGFLNGFEYSKDLTQSLQEFSHHPQGEIWIYTRNLNPTPQQINLLKNLPTQIFYGQWNNSPLQANRIPYLHGKITIIGDKVAYLSSQDLAFSHRSSIDLTLKITNPQTIQNIKHNLHQLH